MSAEYKKLHERYRAASKGVSLDGKPLEGKSDKGRIMGEIRQMERDGIRNGKQLNAVYKGDQVVVDTKDVRTKRSLHEEYVDKFSAEKTVMLDGKEQSLRDYHSRRLLAR